MTTRSFFPTQIYTAKLQRTDWRKFNSRLLRECLQLRQDDEAGIRWSKKNYPGGYTSYNSVARMYEVSPTFAALQKKLHRHVSAYVKSLELDMEGRELAMTDCWVNIMSRGAVHPLHLHPGAVISGTFYVSTPSGCSSIRFEDPRPEKAKAVLPPRRSDCRPENRDQVDYRAEAGKVILFESWLRHEVPANPTDGDRVSVSFNYTWV